jgi:hypothetical protein
MGVDHAINPRGLVLAWYAHNPVIMGVGRDYKAAVKDLRRNHLASGNRADGRWFGMPDATPVKNSAPRTNLN